MTKFSNHVRSDADGDAGGFGSADEAVVDALLQTLYETQASRQKRIDEVIERFEHSERSEAPERSEESERSEEPEQSSDIEATLSPKSELRGSNVWHSVRSRAAVIATAATVVLAIGWFVALTGAATAEASLARVIEASQQSVIRTYEVVVTGWRRQSEFERRLILHSQSDEVFAIEALDTPTQPMVFGRDDRGGWAVVGQRVRRTDETSDTLPLAGLWLDRMRLDRMTVKVLNVNRLFTQIPGRYDLRLGENQPIPGRPDQSTRPLVATLPDSAFRLPPRITIWPDPASHVALRVQIDLPPLGPFRGIHRITADYRGDSDLQDGIVGPESFLRGD